MVRDRIPITRTTLNDHGTDNANIALRDMEVTKHDAVNVENEVQEVECM